jgi:hypothetical protein
VGAVFTYSIGQELPSDTKLVLTITDDTGKQVRRMDQLPVEVRQPGENRQPEELPKAIGIHRIVWNLRGDPVTPAAAPGGAGAPGGRAAGGGGAAVGAAGGAGAAGAGAAGGAQAGRGGGAAGGPPAGAAFGGFGGRGGGAPLVEPGHYTATLGKMTGDTVTPIGKQQSFMVLPLPAKNY